MSSRINQDIRYAAIGDGNNPSALLDLVKPTRIVVNNIGGNPPLENTGENLWWLLDSDSGNFWYKNLGVWILFYTFGSGGGSGITDGSNVGIGNDIFKGKSGSVLEFKTVVSQPQSALESLINIGDVGLNEINITGKSTVSDVINYGTSSDGWIIDSAGTTTDANGNRQLYAKYLVGGDDIQVQTETVGSDKRIVISNIREIIQPSYINASINGLVQVVPNSYVNLTSTWSQTEISSDWAKFTDVGSTWWRYIGQSGRKFKLSVDVYASMAALLGPTQSTIVALASGNLGSQSIVANTGIILEIGPDNTGGGQTYRCNGSLNFIFEPAVNELYTMMIRYNSGASKSITIEQLRWTISSI